MNIKRQSAWSMLPLLISAAVGFFSLPLFLRYLGNDMYALWGYVATFSGMFGFADLGLGVAIGRYIAVALGKNDAAAVRGYWGTGNLLVIPFLALVSLAFIGLGVWLGPKWFNILPGDAGLLRWCFVWGGCGLFFGYYGTYWMVLSQAHLDFQFISVVRVAMNLLQILPALLLAYFTKNPVLLMLWGTLIALLQLGVFAWHANRKYGLALNLREARFVWAREMASYVGKNFMVLLAGSFFGQIDRAMLGRYALPVNFNPYNISCNVASRLQSLSLSVMGPVTFNTARVIGGGREASAKIYNETFAFVFEWYLLATIWIGLWHPVLLRLWLTHTMGMKLGQETAVLMGPLLTPIIIACCLSAMANISTAQLASFNRLGVTVISCTAAGLLVIAGVWVGWHIAGVVGVAYGFLFSRIALVAQDLYVIRLIRAGGWLDRRTWLKVVTQGLVGAVFALSYFAVQRDAYWLLIPALLHGGLVAAWLVRRPLRKFLGATAFGNRFS